MVELPEKLTAANTVVHARSATARIVSIFFILPRRENMLKTIVFPCFSTPNEDKSAVIECMKSYQIRYLGQNHTTEAKYMIMD